MSRSTISDETLMALADGELAQAESVAIRRMIAVDPALAARFAVFVETRMLLQGRVRATAMTAEATPRRLVAAILQHDAELREPGAGSSRDDVSGVHQPSSPTLPAGGASERDVIGAPRAAGNALWRLPTAAAIAFALGGLVGYLAAPRDSSRDLAAVTGILAVPAAQAALAEALSRVPSGGEVSWSDRSSGLSGRVLVVSTHRINEAAACREYEISYRGQSSGSVVGASCRRDETWRTEIAVFRRDPGSGFAPASGASAVEQHLTELGSSGPVSAEDEKAAIAQGWRALR